MKTEVIEVHPEYPDSKAIAYCARIIRQGGLVIFPTETVYGIAADYTNPDAMRRLREVKMRSDDKPFSVLISQKGLITNYTIMSDSFLYKMIDKYWPGPLTIVVNAKDGDGTIGIRMPDHLVALKLVQEAQCMIAAPSANLEGKPPPMTCKEALQDLDGLVDAALDGGAATLGLGSSVVDLTKKPPVVLREGPITQKDVDRLFKTKTILFVCTGNSCRSVMAEYLLKHAMRDRDDLEVLSAGTGVFLNSMASSETIAVLKEEGIDATAHASRSINSILLKKADLVFTMTRSHYAQVLERVPEVEKKVYLLKEFANIPSNFQGDIDIPDPIGRSHQAYKECLELIREAVGRIKELV